MNYTELVAAVQAYADRQDTEVSANMDVFILMAEARMNRLLKTRKQSTIVEIPTVTDLEYYPLPVDYAGMRHMKIVDADGGEANYYYLSPDVMTNRSQTAAGGRNYYTIIANQYHIFPVQEAGSVIEIVYYQKVPNLNATATTNWMSTDYPDIYLSSMLVEVESFAKNFDVAKAWDSKTSRSIAELDDSDQEEVWAGTPLVTRAIF